MDHLASQLAGERLAAFADGVSARRAGSPVTANPFSGNMLRCSEEREWREGWEWKDKNMGADNDETAKNAPRGLGRLPG